MKTSDCKDDIKDSIHVGWYFKGETIEEKLNEATALMTEMSTLLTAMVRFYGEVRWDSIQEKSPKKFAEKVKFLIDKYRTYEQEPGLTFISFRKP